MLSPTTSRVCACAMVHRPANSTAHISRNQFFIRVSMSEYVLLARNLSKTVAVADQQLCILHELSLSLKPGDSLAIVGRSGSGKSTLLGLLAGLDLPSSGEVLIAGQSLAPLDEDQRAALRARE